MIARIADLIQHETAGDPITGLKWTRKTREKVCSELRHLGILVSPNTVGRLLRRMGYSLRVNHKQLSRVCKTPPRLSGIAFARLGDERGYFGRAAQSLVIERREK